MSQTYLKYFRDAMEYQLNELENHTPISIEDISSPIRDKLGNNINLLYLRLFRLALRETYGSKLSNALLYEAGRLTSLRNIKIKSLDQLIDYINKFMLGKMSILSITEDKVVFIEDECAVCSGLPNVGEPMCSFEAGLIAGALSNLYDRYIKVDETHCWGLGDKFCQFEAILNNVDPKKGEKIDTIDLIATLASKASSAIQLNKQLHKQNEMINKQLEFAQNIQKKIIPHMSTFKSNHYKLYTYLKPFRKVGGDFYDFFQEENDKVCFTIADMTGHGIDAAMITGMVKLVLNHCSKRKGLLLNPSKVLQYVEQDILDVVPDTFFSMIYLVLDPIEQSIRYCNAGHPSAILFRKNKNIIQLLQANHPLIGLSKYSDEKNFKTETLYYEKGDKLFLYTDGLIEARNPTGKMYKMDTLLDIIRDAKDLDISNICNEIIKSVDKHRQERDQDDDVCLIGIQL